MCGEGTWCLTGRVVQVGTVGTPFNVSMHEGLGAPLRLWSPDDPYLYNLTVALLPTATSQVMPTTTGMTYLAANRSAGVGQACALQDATPGTCASVQHHAHGRWLPCGAAQAPLDTVASYVGMRKISLGRAGPGNQLRPLLNNEFVFMIGLLDQVGSAYIHHLPFPTVLGYRVTLHTPVACGRSLALPPLHTGRPRAFPGLLSTVY